MRLVGTYPAFFACFLFESVLLTAATVVGTGSVVYAWIYLLCYPAVWILYCLMVRDLYYQIFSSYPGIAMYGRWTIYASAVIALVAVVVGRAATRDALSAKRTLIVGWEAFGRNLVFGLAILILLLLLILSRYPINLRQNIVVNCLCFSLFLLAEAGTVLAEQLTGMRHTITTNEMNVVLDIACFGAWGYLLSREGQTRVVHVLHPSQAEAERLLLELNSLNSILLRAARK